jgi:hypothetical protein
VNYFENAVTNLSATFAAADPTKWPWNAALALLILVSVVGAMLAWLTDTPAGGRIRRVADLPPPGELVTRHVIPEAESDDHDLSVRCRGVTTAPFDGVVVHNQLSGRRTMWAVVDLIRGSS